MNLFMMSDMMFARQTIIPYSGISWVQAPQVIADSEGLRRFRSRILRHRGTFSWQSYSPRL
jgi:hypothetical protein